MDSIILTERRTHHLVSGPNVQYGSVCNLPVSVLLWNHRTDAGLSRVLESSRFGETETPEWIMTSHRKGSPPLSGARRRPFGFTIKHYNHGV